MRAILVGALAAVGCGGDAVFYDAPATCGIDSFELAGVRAVIGGADGKTITVTLPFGMTDLTGLTPRIVSDCEVRATGLERVTAFADGVENTYNVVIQTADESASAIRALKIGDMSGTFGGMRKQIITVLLPHGSSLARLTPEIISDGTVELPGDGAIDFTDGIPQEIRAKAADGTTKVYDLIVKSAPLAGDRIRSFAIGDVMGVFRGLDQGVITVTMPFGATLTGLLPTIASEGRVSGSLESRKLTVTAASGQTKNYQVIVQTADAASHAIRALDVGGVPGVINGDVITVTLPCETDLTDLEPTIISDGVVNIADRTLTVTAGDGSEKSYPWVVRTADIGGNTIQALKIGDISAVIGGLANEVITVTLPSEHSLADLPIRIIHEGTVTAPGLDEDRISLAAGVPTDLTVTAARGQQKIYRLLVAFADASANSIHALNIGGFAGVFSGTTRDVITVTLPYGSPLEDLAPEVVHDGTLKIEDAQRLTVTARNGQTRRYMLIVNVATEAANSIHALRVGDTAGVISGDSITVTLPDGTSLSNVVPTLASDAPVSSPGMTNGTFDFIPGVAQPLIVEAANGDTRTYNWFVETATRRRR